MASESGKPRIIGPQDGEYAGKPGVLHDRFLINGHETDGRFAVVEHLLPPRAIAAPLHRHHHEDEYSYVLEGSVGVWLGGEERVATAGDLVFKPRGQWHTFWNAGDTPARILEFISPGGWADRTNHHPHRSPRRGPRPHPRGPDRRALLRDGGAACRERLDAGVQQARAAV